MHIVYAAAFATIAACGIYLVLSRHVVRIILGLVLLSAAVNLIIFLAGRIDSVYPPVMTAAEQTLPAGTANPLPQAMILTAIVIGFALTAFAAGLALRMHGTLGTLDSSQLHHAEPEDSST